MRLVFRMFEVKVKDKEAVRFLNELERLCRKYARLDPRVPKISGMPW